MKRKFKVILTILLVLAICSGSMNISAFQAWAETNAIDMRLLGSNEVNDPLLAYESAKLSCAAYKENDLKAYYRNELGFDSILTSVYSLKESGSKTAASAGSEDDYVYYMLAKKDIKDEYGEIYHVYSLAVRGTVDAAEWISDAHLDAAVTNYAGFSLPANPIIKDLMDNINKSEKENNILWLTGHSRGGAVVNYLASKLMADSNLVNPERVHTYTFAAANASLQPDSDLPIHNYIFEEDLVPELPLSAWGYGRHGNLYTDSVHNYVQTSDGLVWDDKDGDYKYVEAMGCWSKDDKEELLNKLFSFMPEKEDFQVLMICLSELVNSNPDLVDDLNEKILERDAIGAFELLADGLLNYTMEAAAEGKSVFEKSVEDLLQFGIDMTVDTAIVIGDIIGLMAEVVSFCAQHRDINLISSANTAHSMKNYLKWMESRVPVEGVHVDLADWLGKPLHEFQKQFTEGEYVSDDCYQVSIAGMPAAKVYFMNECQPARIYGVYTHGWDGNPFSIKGLFYGMDKNQVRATAERNGLEVEFYNARTTQVFESTGCNLSGDNLAGSLTWFQLEMVHCCELWIEDRRAFLDDVQSGEQVYEEDEVKFSDYVGKWHSDDSNGQSWNMVLDITEYFDASFNFELYRRGAWYSTPDQEALLTVFDDADFEIYNGYTSEFEMKGKMYFGKDMITMEIGAVAAAYMQDCAGQTIVFYREQDGSGDGLEHFEGPKITFIPPESESNGGNTDAIDYRQIIGKWWCGAQNDKGREYTLTVHEANENEIAFALDIYRLHATEIARAQSIGDGIYTFEAFDEAMGNESISGVLRLENGESGDARATIDKIVMDVDTCTLEYSTDMAGGFYEFEPAYPIITFIYTGADEVSITPVSGTVYKDNASETKLILGDDGRFELCMETYAGSDTLSGTYRKSDTDQYGEYAGDVSNFIFLNVQNCNSSSSIWQYTGSPQEIMMAESEGLYLTALKCDGHWYNSGDYDFIYKELMEDGSGNDNGSGYSKNASSIYMYPYSGTGWIDNCKEWASLRKYPNKSSDRLAQVPYNAEVTVMGETDDFYYCEYEGIEGYILKNYVLFGMS